MDERAYGDVGAEHTCDQQNRSKISPGKLSLGGTCDPIIVDIYTMRHKQYGRHISRSEEYASGKLFALSFLWKVKMSLTHSRNSEYGVGQ